jgi:Zn-dependent protease with chaperone function
MRAASEAVRSESSPLETFHGDIMPASPGFLYKVGLAVVAFAMVLLPAIYIALVALTTWGVVYHLTHDLWLFEGSSGRGAIGRLIAYLGPAVAGGILVFFMVKPFFARRAARTEPLTLDPAKEPLLFAFVEKICRLVRAPVPCRIDLDCQVNASASLRRGLFSRDLVLTIGMPLVSGLDMRQFCGVLAHEFGHFAQGAGMRLTYIIRYINFWFARVVYERDEWDVRLDQAAKESDFRIGIVLQTARGCVWLTRRILWALMHAGHAISCFMLRQMEYDADSYEAKVAGSDAFESTAVRLPVLNVASQLAYEDVRQSWASNRLPENLPLLIGHKAGVLPADVHQKLSTAAAAAKTGWFDTHPCDTDRIRLARLLNEPGIFRLTEPATRLFADFDVLSKAVTRHHYEKEFELEFTEQNLMPAEEILRASAASATADAMVRKYYGAVNITLVPLLTTGELPPLVDKHSALNQWSAAKETAAPLREAAEKISRECMEQQSRLSDLTSAHYLANANFRLNPQEFGLPASATTPGEQQIAAIAAIEETKRTISDHLTKLEPFLAALRVRATAALQVAQAEPTAPADDESDMRALCPLLAAVGNEVRGLHDMALKLRAFLLLIQNRGNHSDPDQINRRISDVATELQSATAGIEKRLAEFAYPFSHARGKLSVAEYARCEGTFEHDLERVYRNSDAHVQRLSTLHYQLVGKVLEHVDAAEKALDTH